MSFAYGNVTGAAAPDRPAGRRGERRRDERGDPPAPPATGDRYVVRTSGRRPGETETIPFTLTAGSPGDSTVTAVMQSPLVPGQTVVRVPVHVHA